MCIQLSRRHGTCSRSYPQVAQRGQGSIGFSYELRSLPRPPRLRRRSRAMNERGGTCHRTQATQLFRQCPSRRVPASRKSATGDPNVVISGARLAWCRSVRIEFSRWQVQLGWRLPSSNYTRTCQLAMDMPSNSPSASSPQLHAGPSAREARSHGLSPRSRGVSDVQRIQSLLLPCASSAKPVPIGRIGPGGRAPV